LFIIGRPFFFGSSSDKDVFFKRELDQISSINTSVLDTRAHDENDINTISSTSVTNMYTAQSLQRNRRAITASMHNSRRLNSTLAWIDSGVDMFNSLSEY
jgi:hypothetical protein